MKNTKRPSRYQRLSSSIFDDGTCVVSLFLLPLASSSSSSSVVDLDDVVQ